MGFVYILFNKPHGTLYTGVTADLRKRLIEHKTKVHPRSFTAGSRAKKIRLIMSMNPEWEDLSDDFIW